MSKYNHMFEQSSVEQFSQYQKEIIQWQKQFAKLTWDPQDIDLNNQIPPTNPSNSHPNRSPQIMVQTHPNIPNILPLQLLVPSLEQLLANRGRGGKNPALRQDYQKNITRDVLKKVATDIQVDPNAQRVVRYKLKEQGIHYSQFQDLLKEILKRNTVSNAILLRAYLAPRRSNDKRRKIKGIFSQYFKYYLNNNLVIAIEESPQIKKLLTYIDYSRRYLAYLDMVEDGNLQPSQNISEPNWI